MGRLFLIVAFLCPAICIGQLPSFSVDDLANISSVSPQNFDDYIVKKGFCVKRRNIFDNLMGYTFYQKRDPSDSNPVTRSIDLYKNGDTWNVAMHTSSFTEFITGRSELKKLNFNFDDDDDTALVSPLVFQRKAITIQAGTDTVEDEVLYTFRFKRKEIPDPGSVHYAEDLLKFDSHEHLVACFGESNVKKDVYLFSETESKKCSILFPNSSHQAVFIWKEENNYRDLSYIIISGTPPTPDADQFNGSYSNNKWELKNGIYQGMRISDLLRLNSNDFKFYGNQSEYSMMVEPKVTGSINFKWIGIGFNCFNCDKSVVLDKQKVSATDAVNNNLAMHVSCIMIKP